jgi:hypothetical protein
MQPGARHRWRIENNFLVEKRQGYQYEHGFSHHWNALRGYHFQMRLGHIVKRRRRLASPPKAQVSNSNPWF